MDWVMCSEFNLVVSLHSNDTSAQDRAFTLTAPINAFMTMVHRGWKRVKN
jgi:hypothetical protein